MAHIKTGLRCQEREREREKEKEKENGRESKGHRERECKHFSFLDDLVSKEKEGRKEGDVVTCAC